MDRVGSSRMRWKGVMLAFVMAGVGVAAQAPSQDSPASPQPSSTPAASTPTIALSPDVVVETAQPFDDWLGALIKEARERGYSEDLVSQTLEGLTPLERVIKNDRSQAELNPGFDRYLSARLTP